MAVRDSASLLDWLCFPLEPKLPGTLEAEYRSRNLRTDIVQFEIFALVAVAGTALFIRSDLLLYRTGPVLAALLAWKAGFAVITLGFILYLRRVTSYERYDGLVFTWLILYSAMMVAVDMTRPPSYTGHFIVNLLNLLSFYLLIPNTLLVRAASAVFFTVLVLLGLFLEAAWIPQIDQFAIIICLALANFVGVIGSTRMYRYRRKEFQLRLETDRQRRELNELVQQREWLIRETNHRVKNNLLVIDTLLKMQAAGDADPALRERLDQSRSRLQSMRILHEKLYRAHDLASIPLASFLHDLTRTLLEVYRSPSSEIELTEEVQEIETDPRTATACGMIVNELITNSLRHGFPDGGSARLELSLHCEGALCTLSLGDDGIGLPEGFDPAGRSSMGMLVVQNYVAQLGGKLSLGQGPGAGFTIVFPFRSPIK